MKILIINFEYPPLGGGGGVATKQLAEELGKRHEVHILTTGYEGLEKKKPLMVYIFIVCRFGGERNCRRQLSVL